MEVLSSTTEDKASTDFFGATEADQILETEAALFRSLKSSGLKRLALGGCQMSDCANEGKL